MKAARPKQTKEVRAFFRDPQMILDITLYMTLQHVIGLSSLTEQGLDFFGIRVTGVASICFRILLEINKSLTATLKSIPHAYEASLKNWLENPSVPRLLMPGILNKDNLISLSNTGSHNYCPYLKDNVGPL